ncbi:1-acylglycerol-3-phosphate O-acyltransferase [Chytriomyces hyalinus]|nr:1-acylglycerol-3-phosphate O-acyltransferase [Chytriomyces hyalinus]KAJ3390870.1 1-acylglycerol-3-phosphate O-acyltransferase [Chytriomyces hyalinus]
MGSNDTLSADALYLDTLRTSWLPATGLFIALFLVVAFRAFAIVRFTVRFLGFVWLLFVASVSGILATLFERALFGQKRLYLHKHSLHFVSNYLMPLVINVRTEIIEGAEYLENTRPCVFIMNHQSELDLLVQSSFVPADCMTMAKEEFKKIPLIGSYMVLSRDAVFIKRSNLADAMATVTNATKEVIDRKVSLHVYVEGTRSYQETNDLLPFKKGAFHTAIGNQIPIIPIVAESYHGIYNFRNKMFDGGVIKIKVLPPISTVGLGPDDVGTMLESCRDLMHKTLIEISQPAPKWAKALKAPKSKKKAE